MVVEMMYRQDIENEVIDYIRNSGECVVDYDIDAIVDCLVVLYEHEGVEFYRYCFETVVFYESCSRVRLMSEQEF